MGKADAADSVPGPGPEKKTANGVWFAIGDPSPASDPVDKVEVMELRIEGLAPVPWPVPRTLGLVTAAVTFAAANRSAAISGTNWAAGFGIDKAEI